MVCYGSPVQAPALMFDEPGYDEFEAAVSYLDAALQARYGQDDVYSWNDDRGRTTEEVLRVLSEVAESCPGDSTVDGVR